MINSIEIYKTITFLSMAIVLKSKLYNYKLGLLKTVDSCFVERFENYISMDL